jgi:seryl-tRNA synthetase
MLSRDLYRSHPDVIRTMLSDRHTDAPLDRLLEVDGQWREVLQRAEDLKAQRNAGSKEIGALFRNGRRDEAEARKADMTRIGDEVRQLEERSKSLEEELASLELQIPNLLMDDVPRGRNEDDNREVRTWGERPTFEFEPKAHWDLGPELKILDFERATKISGARFSVLRGAGAALERALISYMLDAHVRRHGYTEVMVPYMVLGATLEGTGQLPKFADDLFRIADRDLFLVPTAEVPVTNLHRDEILDEASLPIRYCAFTPCFRAEAGSHGKDVRGLIRQHQFHKVELVQFTSPETSAAGLEELTGHAEAILQGLELPYRVMELCSGDTGFSAARTYDLEVWLPGQDRYREISSCSVFNDFQARRARIRCRPVDGGKARLVHTLNGSGLAVGRALVAVLENYQRADGSVTVPVALRPYLGGLERIDRNMSMTATEGPSTLG